MLNIFKRFSSNTPEPESVKEPLAAQDAVSMPDEEIQSPIHHDNEPQSLSPDEAHLEKLSVPRDEESKTSPEAESVVIPKADRDIQDSEADANSGIENQAAAPESAPISEEETSPVVDEKTAEAPSATVTEPDEEIPLRVEGEWEAPQDEAEEDSPRQVRERLEEAEKANRHQRNQLMEKSRRLAESEVRYAQLQAKLTERERTIDTLKTECTEKDRLLSSREVELQNVKDELEERKRALASQSERVLEQNRKLAELEIETERLRNELQEKEHAVTSLREQLAAKTQLLADRDAQYLQLQGKLEEKEKAIELIRAQLVDKTQALADKELTCLQLQTEAVEKKCTIDRQREQLAQKERELADRDVRIRQLQAESEEKDRTIEQQREDILGRARDLAERNHENTELREYILEGEKIVKRNVSQVNNLMEEFKTLERSILWRTTRTYWNFTGLMRSGLSKILPLRERKTLAVVMKNIDRFEPLKSLPASPVLFSIKQLEHHNAEPELTDDILEPETSDVSGETEITRNELPPLDKS